MPVTPMPPTPDKCGTCERPKCGERPCDAQDHVEDVCHGHPCATCGGSGQIPTRCTDPEEEGYCQSNHLKQCPDCKPEPAIIANEMRVLTDDCPRPEPAKATCLSLDCPERKGGECRHALSAERGGWEERFDEKFVREEKPIKKDGYNFYKVGQHYYDLMRWVRTSDGGAAEGDDCREELKSFVRDVEMAAREEGIKCVGRWYSLPQELVGELCPVCGGKTVEIRAKYPNRPNRRVCPTCTREVLESIYDGCNNREAQTANKP